MNDVQFADPWVLGLLAALPLLALIHRGRPARRLRGGVVLSTLAPLAEAPRGWRARLRPFYPMLRLPALALLIVALARPQTVEANARIASEGIDIVLALDISGSMGESGLDPPKKLDAAKKALKRFL